MSKYCEITGCREAHESKGKSKRPSLLKRKIDVPEYKTSIRLRVSNEGLEVLKKMGGLVNFMKSKANGRLSPKLHDLNIRYGIMHEKEVVKVEDPVAEAKAEKPEKKAKEE